MSKEAKKYNYKLWLAISVILFFLSLIPTQSNSILAKFVPTLAYNQIFSWALSLFFLFCILYYIIKIKRRNKKGGSR